MVDINRSHTPDGKILITGINGQSGKVAASEFRFSDKLICGTQNVTKDRYCPDESEDEKGVVFTYMDLSESESIKAVIANYRPDYLFHYAGLTFVNDAKMSPDLAFRVNSESVIHLLEAVKNCCPRTRIFLAGSSEQYSAGQFVNAENIRCHKPRSFYGMTKSTMHNIGCLYREQYGLYVTTGVLYNNSSKYQSSRFLLHKIASSLAAIRDCIIEDRLNDIEPLRLGNMQSKRDFTHTKDTVHAAWSMLNQQSEPKDYTICSGTEYSVEYITNKFIHKMLGDYLGDIAQKPNYKVYYKDALIIEGYYPEYMRYNDQVSQSSFADIYRDLGWRPQSSLEDIIREVSNYYGRKK